MDYSTLFVTIKGYIENEFPATIFTDSDGNSVSSALFTSKEQIDTFIQLAEERIYNSVQIPAIRKNQTGYMTGGNKYLSLPSDWLATFSLSVIVPIQGTLSTTQNFLLDKDVNYIREAFPIDPYFGVPTHYAQFTDSSLILGPTPDASYQVELHYYYYPESIVTATTSWLGNNFESVLLYGSLREAAVFVKAEPDMVANYEGKYQESLGLLKQLGDGKNRRDAYRSGQVRIPVQ
jgi:hypothetical protein